MFAALRRRLSFANVVSLIALFVALGTGGAYAANTIGSDDIIDESILSQDLKNQEVRAADIHNGGVTGEKLQAGAVTSGKVADDAITSPALATNSVGATEVADGSIDSGEIVDDSLLAQDLGASSVGTSELATNAVNGAKVSSNSLTTADIAGADVNGGGISVPTGYVPNGRCRQLDAGVGGAKAGEGVIFSVKAALQAGVFIYGQRVPSDGHVTFDVCNLSGTTQAGISDLPVRVITFG
jgi:hypothetical protein